MGMLLDLALRGMPNEDGAAVDAGAHYRLTPAAEARKQRALALLAQRPGIRHAVVSDDSEADAVILAVAIRDALPDGGTVTCELRIPRAKYDAFLLLDLLERHGGKTH
jgi:hypothetical protein